MNNTYINKYASSLLSVALEENKNQQYKEYIASFSELLDEDKSLIEALNNKFLSKSERYALVDKVFIDSPSSNINNFVKVIIKNNRILDLNRIFKEFIFLSNTHEGIQEGYIYSYEKLSESEIKKISLAIEKKIKQKIYLKQRIDKSLLGGFKVVINDHIYDYSLEKKRQNLKNQLLGGSNYAN